MTTSRSRTIDVVAAELEDYASRVSPSVPPGFVDRLELRLRSGEPVAPTGAAMPPRATAGPTVAPFRVLRQMPLRLAAALLLVLLSAITAAAATGLIRPAPGPTAVEDRPDAHVRTAPAWPASPEPTADATPADRPVAAVPPARPPTAASVAQPTDDTTPEVDEEAGDGEDEEDEAEAADEDDAADEAETEPSDDSAEDPDDEGDD